jgi:hypothetical protein
MSRPRIDPSRVDAPAHNVYLPRQYDKQAALHGACNDANAEQQ